VPDFESGESWLAYPSVGFDPGNTNPLAGGFSQVAAAQTPPWTYPETINPAVPVKLAQLANVQCLNAIYETDFLGFSYGFRPGRGQHNALDAVYVGLKRRVSWVLEVDIKGFFDAIDHRWLMTFVEHRIADVRVLRLIQKWLNAGVIVDGKRMPTEEGDAAGRQRIAAPREHLSSLRIRSLDPVLATKAGEVIVVRYTDDIVMQGSSRAPSSSTLHTARRYDRPSGWSGVSAPE
jgi:RNA-directed DNA polymerase